MFPAAAQHLRDHLNQLDPTAVDGPDALIAVAELSTLINQLCTARLHLARRVADTDTYRTLGHSNATTYYAAATGISRYDARLHLDTAKHLPSMPALGAALSHGLISLTQAAEIASATKENPAAETDLITCATRDRDLATLKRHCLDAKRAVRDDQGDHDRHQRNRSCRTGTTPDGAWWLNLHSTPDIGARIKTMILPLRDRIQRACHADGIDITLEAAEHDALIIIVTGHDPHHHIDRIQTRHDRGLDLDLDPTSAGANDPDPADTTDTPDDTDSPDRAERAHPTSGTDTGPDADTGPDTPAPGPRPTPSPGPHPTRPTLWDHPAPPWWLKQSTRYKVIVAVSHPALLRGYVLPGERCDIDGQPATVTAVQALIPDAYIAAILTDGVNTYQVAHTRRSFNAHQQTLLEWRDPRCSVAGCPKRWSLINDHDHQHEWHPTRVTSTDWADRYCPTHNNDRTYGHHRMEPGIGPRRLLTEAQWDHEFSALTQEELDHLETLPLHLQPPWLRPERLTNRTTPPPEPPPPDPPYEPARTATTATSPEPAGANDASRTHNDRPRRPARRTRTLTTEH